MFKKLLIFISLITLILNVYSSVVAEIVPIKKPLQTKEEKEKKLLIDIVKPLPKPKIIKEIDKEDK